MNVKYVLKMKRRFEGQETNEEAVAVTDLNKNSGGEQKCQSQDVTV